MPRCSHGCAFFCIIFVSFRFNGGRERVVVSPEFWVVARCDKVGRGPCGVELDVCDELMSSRSSFAVT